MLASGWACAGLPAQQSSAVQCLSGLSQLASTGTASLQGFQRGRLQKLGRLSLQPCKQHHLRSQVYGRCRTVAMSVLGLTLP